MRIVFTLLARIRLTHSDIMSHSSTRQPPSGMPLNDGLSAGAPDTISRKGLAISPLMRLVRIEFAVSGAVAVFLGAFLAGGHVISPPVLLSAATVLFVATACYALDDLADMESDRYNERADRPLLTGEVTARTARTTGLMSLVLASITATAAGTAASLFIAAGAATAIVYNRWLQSLVPLKNVLFAGAFPVVLVIGLLSSGGTPKPVFLYAVSLMFVAGLGFETMIDIADVRGDRATSVASFATRYGIRVSSRTAAALLVAAALLLVLLFFLPVDPRLQANPIFLSLALFIAASKIHIGIKLLRDSSPHRILALKRHLFLSITLAGIAIAIGLLVSVP